MSNESGTDGDFTMPTGDEELPTPIFFMEPLEFIIALTCIGVGTFSEQYWFLGIISAIGVIWGAKELKKGAKRGAVQHFLWKIGLDTDPKLKKIVNSWDNDFVE